MTGNSHSSTNAGLSFPLSVPASFHVFIAYDKPSNASRAMLMADRLAKQLGSDVSVHRNLWRFDVLSFPDARTVACAEAVGADLIIVAADAEVPLPASVQRWLKEWGARSIPASCGLVALLETSAHGNASHSPVYFFLEALAEKAGQAFFFHEFSSEIA